ncbi:uncharacterized protein LOC108143665 [Drosophila elegans]|uniref:uncharacterized protein LOC108143665 n=1 Tax=Drosophila elegans TaxID=30023 RepID=UPI0007E69D9B|nr:uncharacterized protein LOC108143665 [Drosophila elegans]
MCQSCEDFSPQCCATFYPIWCIVLGAFFTASAIYLVVDYTNKIDNPYIFSRADWDGDDWDTIEKIRDKYRTYRIISIIKVIIDFTYVVAGILLLLGDKMNKKRLFKFGKVLSYFFPICSVMTVFTIIVHICAVIKLCRYIEQRWGIANN